VLAAAGRRRQVELVLLENERHPRRHRGDETREPSERHRLGMRFPLVLARRHLFECAAGSGCFAFELREELLRLLHVVSFGRDNGSSRTRLPVAAKIALARAAITGGTPGSPTPVGSASLSTMCTLVWTGAVFMRATAKSLKLLWVIRPFAAVISPLMVSPAAITAAPSNCALTRSGFTTTPASTTCSTRGMRIPPRPSSSTSTTDAT